jgi:hypothetical protein
VKYGSEMTSGGMIFMRRFMTTSSDAEVILNLLPQQFDGIQCWYY